jgi:hypothetical protein
VTWGAAGALAFMVAMTLLALAGGRS